MNLLVHPVVRGTTLAFVPLASAPSLGASHHKRSPLAAVPAALRFLLLPPALKYRWPRTMQTLVKGLPHRSFVSGVARNLFMGSLLLPQMANAGIHTETGGARLIASLWEAAAGCWSGLVWRFRSLEAGTPASCRLRPLGPRKPAILRPATLSASRAGYRGFGPGRAVCLLFGVLLASQAQASFHTWKISEIYSSADGSVQFIELHESLGFDGQEFLAGHFIQCVSGSETNTFIFPTDLPSSTTANKDFVIGTANLSTVPGGVVPDYVLTNAVPFLFAGSGTIQYAGVDTVAYMNLPSDGVAALARSGSSMVFAPTNSVTNFSGASNSVVPVRFSSVTVSGASILLTFPTATGPNQTTGPQYETQTNTTLGTTNWGSVTNLIGDGTVKTVAIPMNTPQLLFRLRVP